jgi:hypothetical protein
VTRYYFLPDGFCLKVAVLCLWGALSDERTGLQFADFFVTSFNKEMIILQVGNTLVFVLYLIAKNPRVQERLYEEILQLAPGRCPLTAETLRQATYLQACLMEAFRHVTGVLEKEIL